MDAGQPASTPKKKMIQALPTIYNGFKFSSRLEARWSKFFDLMNIPYEYEKEAFDLDGLTYFPDFWLPTLCIWFEVKGEIITDEIGLKIVNKCTRLATQSNYPVALTFHDPLDMRCALWGTRGNMHPDAHFAACSFCGTLGVSVRVNGKLHLLCPNKSEHTEAPLPLDEHKVFRRKVFEAATEVRQTKFAFQRKAS